MTTWDRLYAEYGQSPWLDNLTRGYLHDGTLARMVADGIRGVTANPAISTKAIVGSTDVAGFHTSDQEVPAALVAKADQLGRR
jgi:transaldolase